MKPEVEIIRHFHWHGFLTFTFRNPLPSIPKQEWSLMRWFTWAARQRDVYFPDLLYLPRFEQGEKTQRDHYHSLIAFSTGQPHQSFFEAGENVWKDYAGYADFRVFNPRLDGVGYVLDGLNESSLGGESTTGANKYEVSKFGRAETFVPESVKRVVLATLRRSAFWCVKCDMQKSMCTCSSGRLPLTALSAVMRGQKLGAV